MRYRVELRPAAQRSLARLRGQTRLRIEGALLLLAQNPRPRGAIALQGRDGFRVRVGDYRIIYSIHDDVLVVAVVEIGHRRDAYRSR